MTAHALSRAEPESVGLSSTRLRRIGEALRREVADGQIPGAVVGIMRGGKLAHLEAVGHRDAAQREPLATDAIFSIASSDRKSITDRLWGKEGGRNPVLAYASADAGSVTGSVVSTER